MVDAQSDDPFRVSDIGFHSAISVREINVATRAAVKLCSCLFLFTALVTISIAVAAVV